MSATRLDGIVELEENEQIVLVGRSKLLTKLILTNKRLIEATSRRVLSEYKLENIVHVSGSIEFGVGRRREG
jgi:hypothetical protein